MFLAPILLDPATAIRFVVQYQQLAFNCVMVSWLITAIAVPFLWPQKPGDYFHDNFSAGVNPRVWNYVGQWQSRLDENGKPVLVVTESEMGGIAIPCLSWVDYELEFELGL